MYKNVAGQYTIVYAIDSTTGLPKTGDAANITAYISKDTAAAAQSNDVNPTELNSTNMKGLYAFLNTQTETNCDLFALSAVSSTANITLDPVVTSTVQSATDILTTQMTESYAADTVAPTLAQALFAIQQGLSEFDIVGTLRTVKKLDKTTTAQTFDLNDASNPTSTTRSA